MSALTWREEVELGFCAFCALVAKEPLQHVEVTPLPGRAWVRLTAWAPAFGRYGPRLAVDVPEDVELPGMWALVREGDETWTEYPANGEELKQLEEVGFWPVGVKEGF